MEVESATSTSWPPDCSKSPPKNAAGAITEIVARFTGDKLERAVFRHPFLERDSLGILADHVTLEQGTGAVHTAPGHGQEDYVVGRQYGIETYCPVDAAGRFFHADGAAGRLPEELIGKTVWEANPIVIEILKSAGALLAMEKLEHSYPHCWRCHHPTIFRATEQWFIGMDRNDFRAARAGCRPPDALDAGLGRGAHRQHDRHAARLVHLAPARVGRSDHRLLLRAVPRAASPTARSSTASSSCSASTRADVWYERTRGRAAARRHRRAPSAAAAEFSKENDILDVWFDSGSSHLAVLNERFGLTWPADLYMEGGDQYRGWFHSSLLVGVGIKGGSPYRACALNGWVLDGEGRAMHKSLGNSIEPEEVIKHYGAEILRLWSASVEFHEDVRVSETILTPPGGSLPQAAQHVPLPAGQSVGLRPGARCRAGRRAARDRPVDSAARRRPGGALPRVVRRTSSSTRSTTRSTPSPRWT